MAVVKAESAVAYLAKKVHVLVLIAVLILAPTKLITGSAVAILHGMHHVTLTKEGQRPKNIRLVDGLYLYLKVAHRQRMAPGGQRLHDEYAVGRGRSEEHTSELQSRQYLVCRLLLEKTH